MQVTIEDVQVNAGERAKFQAVIEGTPQPTVLWFKVSAGLSLAESNGHRKDCSAVLLRGTTSAFSSHTVYADSRSCLHILLNQLQFSLETPTMHLPLGCLQCDCGSFHREGNQDGLGDQDGQEGRSIPS